MKYSTSPHPGGRSGFRARWPRSVAARHDAGQLKELPCGGGSWQLAADDLRRQARQQITHCLMVFERVLQARVNALPHPRQGLLLATRRQFSVAGLQVAKFADLGPEGIDTAVEQGADLHHLWMPERLDMVEIGRAHV